MFEPHALLRRPGGLYFKIERGLGGGSMGEVYVVRDGNLANRQRVIKVLQAELAPKPVAVERFLRKARAMARLRHPNIVSIEDIGMLEDERGRPTVPYYVMPFVEGESLRALLDQKRTLPPGRALDLIRQAASGLAAMHAAGVIHCDVKPDNLVISKADGALVLIDFGVMHLEVEGAREGFYGTYGYASEHQLEGHAPRREDDLYSLSMVLYELLVGVRPFAEHGSGVKGALARAGKHAISLRERGIDHAILETLVERGIHPDVAKRWPDAETMMRSAKHVRTLFDDAKPLAALARSPANAARIHLQTTRVALVPAPAKITPTDLADPTRPRLVHHDEIVTRVPPARKPWAQLPISETKPSVGVVSLKELIPSQPAKTLPPPFRAALDEARVEPPKPRPRIDIAVLALSIVVLAASIVGAGWVLAGSTLASTPAASVASAPSTTEIVPASKSVSAPETVTAPQMVTPDASASSHAVEPMRTPLVASVRKRSAPPSTSSATSPTTTNTVASMRSTPRALPARSESGIFDPWAAPPTASSYPLTK
ncbi:hypothetical protein BH09MYX1_BH09MYX1_59810 [soil metagenome]